MRNLEEIVNDNNLAALRSVQANEDLPSFIIVDEGKFIYRVHRFDFNTYTYTPASTHRFTVHSRAVLHALELYRNAKAAPPVYAEVNESESEAIANETGPATKA
jgi:hypothetical protein